MPAMKFRTGVAVGFGVGYVMGAKAGRERYEQIKGWFDRIAGNEQVQRLASKGKAVVDIGAERARSAISEGLGNASQKVRDLAEG